MMIVGNSLQQGETVATDDVVLRNHILKTLKYFHVFRHPLYEEEIHSFLQIEVTRAELQHTLSDMARVEQIFYAHNMYSLENSAQIFLKRKVGADMAAEKLKEARRCAAIIASFPFVKGVCVSGSLSKGYADEKSDIDFFIITAERRLWISRTLLHLFKKLTFLANRQHSFCMNYFIDESRLSLEEKNLFTATELVTLIPVYNSDLHHELVNLNKDWIADIFPNTDIYNTQHNALQATSFIKKPVERLLNNLWPEKFNNFLMNLTDRLWRHKWERKNYPMEDYELAMKTKWYVSKQHPLNYQKKVLRLNSEESYRVATLDI